MQRDHLNFMSCTYSDDDIERMKVRRRNLAQLEAAETSKKDRKFYQRRIKAATIVINYLTGENIHYPFPEELWTEIQAAFLCIPVNFREVSK